MLTLQLPTRPPRDPDLDPETSDEGPSIATRVRAGQYGELEEHELIHLLDSIDDEPAEHQDAACEELPQELLAAAEPDGVVEHAQ